MHEARAVDEFAGDSNVGQSIRVSIDGEPKEVNHARPGALGAWGKAEMARCGGHRRKVGPGGFAIPRERERDSTLDLSKKSGLFRQASHTTHVAALLQLFKVP
jgi:hypothetical protein